jgi:hypothetical protein
MIERLLPVLPALPLKTVIKFFLPVRKKEILQVSFTGKAGRTGRSRSAIQLLSLVGEIFYQNTLVA